MNDTIKLDIPHDAAERIRREEESVLPFRERIVEVLRKYGCSLPDTVLESLATAMARFRATEADRLRARGTSPLSEGFLTADEVRDWLRRECDNAGSQKRWGETHDVREQYVCDVLAGRRNIGPAICKALGLRQTVGYEILF